MGKIGVTLLERVERDAKSDVLGGGKDAKPGVLARARFAPACAAHLVAVVLKKLSALNGVEASRWRYEVENE